MDAGYEWISLSPNAHTHPPPECTWDVRLGPPLKMTVTAGGPAIAMAAAGGVMIVMAGGPMTITAGGPVTITAGEVMITTAGGPGVETIAMAEEAVRYVIVYICVCVLYFVRQLSVLTHTQVGVTATTDDPL